MERHKLSEKKRAYYREYRRINKEELQEYTRKRRQDPKVARQAREQARRYYWDHREEIMAKRKLAKGKERTERELQEARDQYARKAEKNREKKRLEEEARENTLAELDLLLETDV